MLDYNTLLTTHISTLKKDQQLIETIHQLTSHINIDFENIKHRLWHLANKVDVIPLCSQCQTTTVKWDKNKNVYTTCCSKKCATKLTNNNPEIQEKRKQTNIDRYGGVAPACNKEIQLKQTHTKKQKYGDDLSSAWRDKIKTATQQKYGVDNVSQLALVKSKKSKTWRDKDLQTLSQIVDKRKSTNVEKYGVDNPQKNEIVRQKTTATNIERYGFVIAIKNEQVQNKKHQTCLRKYGTTTFAASTIDTANMQKLNDPLWLTHEHHILKKPLTLIAKQLNVDITTDVGRFDKFSIERKMFSRSSGEFEINEFIKNFNIQTITNTKKIIHPKEIDIYIPSHNLAIEHCGLYWHCDKHERIANNYHYNKWKACRDKGIRLLTIFGDEWLEKREIVESKIINCLNLDNRPSIYARKCSIVNVNKTQSKRFLDQYHIQGDGPGSIMYGLQHDNKLVAVMCFIKKGTRYDLNRYASSGRVVGGFSKLLKHFQNNNNWSQIVSFADLRWSDGDLYNKNGFMLDKILPPDYYWVVDDTRQHKFNWRHDGNLKHLPNYDKNLSEAVNMINHGYHKIFNCGLQRWVINSR